MSVSVCVRAFALAAHCRLTIPLSISYHKSRRHPTQLPTSTPTLRPTTAMPSKRPNTGPTSAPTYTHSLDFVSVYRSASTGYGNSDNAITVENTTAPLSIKQVSFRQYSYTAQFGEKVRRPTL